MSPSLERRRVLAWIGAAAISSAPPSRNACKSRTAARQGKPRRKVKERHENPVGNTGNVWAMAQPRMAFGSCRRHLAQSGS